MEKKVLLIDNEDIQATLDSIIEISESDTELKYKTKCLDWFNPVDRQFYDSQGNYNFELARRELVETILPHKIDVIGCDFNLHSEHKVLTYEIIKTVREYNKTATVFIYSGGINKSTLELFNSLGKGPAEAYLNIAMNSNIYTYINNRGSIPERIVEMLKEPSIGLQIEDFLMQNESLKLQHFLEIFKGRQLFEIAKEIRLQSKLGIKFTEELIERGASHIIDLNTD